MDKLQGTVIGIAGAKNSGKDTVASMINYIFAVGITRASYADYMIKRAKMDNTNADRIVHFADNMKDVMSIMFGIPREAFDDRQKKDNEYWDYFNKRFVNFAEVLRNSNCIVIDTVDDIYSHKSFREVLDFINIEEYDTLYIKVRALMQYFGTDICRHFLDENIWVNSTIVKVREIAAARRLCIVPDVRFDNEARAIKGVGISGNASLYGGVIKVSRGDNSESEHSSENIDFPVDFEIDNNGGLMQLFFKVLEICQKLI